MSWNHVARLSVSAVAPSVGGNSLDGAHAFEKQSSAPRSSLQRNISLRCTCRADGLLSKVSVSLTGWQMSGRADVPMLISQVRYRGYGQVGDFQWWSSRSSRCRGSGPLFVECSSFLNTFKMLPLTVCQHLSFSLALPGLGATRVW